MLSSTGRTRLVATSAAFAALFAVLGTIPVSKYVLGSGFLTANKVIAPLIGMLLGPIVGGLSSILGDVVDFAYAGQFATGQVRFDVLVADLAVVTTAGLTFTGRRVAAVALPSFLILLYSLDPLAVVFVGVVPFVWLHAVSVGLLVGALWLERRGRIGRLNPFFIGSVTFASLMAGQVAGTVVGMNLMVRFGTTSVDAWRGALTNFIFPLYPVERVFYAVAGTLISVPVLRALARDRKTAKSSE